MKDKMIKLTPRQKIILSLIVHEHTRTAQPVASRTLIEDYGLQVSSAMEPAFTADSPGWVLLAKEINWAIEQGMTEVDLMRGDEDYKYRFGGIDRHVISFKARLA